MEYFVQMTTKFLSLLLCIHNLTRLTTHEAPTLIEYNQQGTSIIKGIKTVDLFKGFAVFDRI